MPSVVHVTSSEFTTFGSNVFISTVSYAYTHIARTALILFNSPRPLSAPTTFFGEATTNNIFIAGSGSLSSWARVAAKVVVPT